MDALLNKTPLSEAELLQGKEAKALAFPLFPVEKTASWQPKQDTSVENIDFYLDPEFVKKASQDKK